MYKNSVCQRLALLDYLRTHCLSLLQRSLSIKVADKLIIPQGHLLGAVWQQSDSIANQYCINWLSWPILTLSKYMEIKIKAQNMVNQNRTRFNHVWPFLLYKCLNKQLKETKGFAYNDSSSWLLAARINFQGGKDCHCCWGRGTKSVDVCVSLSVQTGVPYLLRSVLHTVTLGCVCPGTEHRVLGWPDCLTGGILLVLNDKDAKSCSKRQQDAMT